jgi:hypothetical protein
VKILPASRRNAAAARLALLAVASLGLVAVAAAVPMSGALRSVLAGAALCGYAYFGGRAMEVLQGRGIPRWNRPAWRLFSARERRYTHPPVEVRGARAHAPEGVTTDSAVTIGPEAHCP